MTGTATTATFLHRIVAQKRREVAERRERRPLAEVERAARARPPALDFAAALVTPAAQREAAPGMRLIAEVKGKSPSRGTLIAPFEPEAIAADYLAAGADAISVLTDEQFFGGSLDHLAAVGTLARAVDPPRPVLRKDFLLDAYQLAEARAAGADAILLIVAMLDTRTLRELHAGARARGMAALVEVHDERELDLALTMGAALVGINNRDLHSFRVDLATTERLAPLVPPGVTIVGESGIGGAEDVQRLADAGVDAVLVGESLVRAADRGAAVRALLGRDSRPGAERRG
jgi:indole-3-glycerol phosphate synthase